jgi:predicted nucleic acid-binding protein
MSLRTPRRSSPVLVDSGVLIDIATDDRHWAGWSARMLAALGQGAQLVINPLIHAEVSAVHGRIEMLDALLPEDVFHREPLPPAAAFLAVKAFMAYDIGSSQRRTPLPDLHVGAHAVIRGYRLLTRHRGHCRGHFPDLQVICPEP